MKPVIDLTKEYGIVLEGGGARGAYQIGAWIALEEAGVKIKGVAGTSVGALNGALICMGDVENARQLWTHITYSQIMAVDDEKMRQLVQEHGFSIEILRDVLAEGGLDVTPLKELIAQKVDVEKIKNSPTDLYVLTFSVDEGREIDIDIKETPPELIRDYLLASAYLFPLFKNEKLHGKTYIDGGAVNNVPLGSLVERGYEDIIVIRIYGIGREKRVKIPEGTSIYTIAPTVSLGSILDFNPTTSQLHIRRGYFDGKRMIYGLAGKIYYIDEQEEGCYYLKQLIDLAPQIREYLMDVYKLEQDPNRYLRNMTEIILPALAEEMKLGKNWNYRELYLTMLEAAAKLCRVRKYQIYTVQDLQEKVWERLLKRTGEELPAFVQVIAKDRLI